MFCSEATKVKSDMGTFVVWTLLQGKLVGRQVTLDLFGDQKKSAEKKMLDLLLDLQHSKM